MIMSLEESLVRSRISQIETRWSQIADVRDANTEVRHTAQVCFLRRYSLAIERYLQASLKSSQTINDEGEVRDVFDRFVDKLLDGKLAPEQSSGAKFRFFVKRVLSNSLRDHFRRAKLRKHAEYDEQHERAVEPKLPEFDDFCRESVLRSTWDKMSATHPDAYLVLRLKADHREESIAELMARSECENGRRFPREDAFRQTLRRARLQFGQLLLEDVAKAIGTRDREEIESELVAMGLADYCKSSLKRWE